MELTLESFSETHAHLWCDKLVEAARAVLGKFHTSPVWLASAADDERRSYRLTFDAADPRLGDTYQREDLIEEAAITVAGLMLREYYGLCISRVVSRGSYVDYYVGTDPHRPTGVVEIAGTESRSLDALHGEKQRQARRSSERVRLVAVTRFDKPATICSREPPNER